MNNTTKRNILRIVRRLPSLVLALAVLVTLLPQRSFANKGDFRSLANEILTQGAVLLKNDGTLPLKSSNTVSLFGSAQINSLVGGGGSSVMFTDYIVTPLQGMRAAAEKGSFNLNETLAGVYESYIGKREEIIAVGGAEAFDENAVNAAYKSEELILDEATVNAAADASDTAIYIISRFATEGSDMTAEAGSYYLSETEHSNLNLITSSFSRVVVLLNIPTVLDTSWFGGASPTYNINSVMNVWYLGEDGGNVIASLLSGESNPSGKLTVTAAADYTDYLSSANFDQKRDVLYEEDIFVGYRQFETFDPDYSTVNYEFGFGLSYSTFDINVESVALSDDGSELRAAVKVTNTGDYAGREVVQVYFSAPQGKLGKPGKELAAFAKTSLLSVGASETLNIAFPVNDMSSYDDIGSVAESAYVLEAGDYNIYIGNSIRNAGERGIAYTYNVESDRVTEQLTKLSTPTRLRNRLLADGSYADVERRSGRIQDVITGRENNASAPESLITLIDVYNDESLWDSFLAQLTIEEMAQMAGGTDVTIGSAAGAVFGNLFTKYGVPNIDVTDGSVGVRVSSHATYFPSGVCLASTWNCALAEEFGRAIGEEAAMSRIDVWLGPGLNLIRNPLCGRNFEYSSEDPLVTGKIGAAIVRGVQSQNVGVTLKHYFANNKETDRGPSDSQLTERAAREIYLKCFEICVRESDPWGIMTTCGTVNGQGVAGNYEYMTAIPRNEWGFTGFFMSDWANMDNEIAELRAGHNLGMPKHNAQVLINAYNINQITRAQLEDNTYWLLSNLMKLRSFIKTADKEFAIDISSSQPSSLLLTDYITNSSFYILETNAGVSNDLTLAALTLGDTFDYRIRVDKATDFTITADYASANGGGGFDLYIDGELAHSFDLNATTLAWTSWRDSDPAQIHITEGLHDIRIEVTSHGMNLHKLTFTPPEASSGNMAMWLYIGGAVLVAAAAVVVIVIVRRKKGSKKGAEA